MDIIVGGPLKPNGQNVPTRVGEIVSDYSELANIPNPRVGMEVWVASKKEAVRILTLKDATIAGVVVPNAVVDTWEVVPNRAMTTSLATKISEEEQRATLAEGALRDKVTDLENNYFAKMSELDTEVESLHSEDANLQSNINEIQLDLQSKINELGQEYLKGIEDVNRGITRIDAKAIQIGSFEVEPLTDGIGVNFSNIDGTQSDSFEIPAATTERAGVMSAEDKKEQVKKTPLVNGDIIVGQAREVYSRQGKIDSATFLKRTTAGGTSVSDGVASVKQIGGNIVKNLVDGTFGDGWDKFSTIAIANGVAKITTTSPYAGVSYAVQLVTGHKYYAKVDACGNNAFYVSFTKSKPYYISQQWACVSFLHTSVNNDIALRIMATSAKAQGFFKKPLVIDLTEMFGAGNEPTKEECDNMFGTMDALPQGLTISKPTGLKSTGYNQWNPENVLINKTITDNAIVDGDKNIAVVECLPCKVGAGENNGYVIGYGEGDSWSDEGIEVYLTLLNPMEIEGELYMHKLEKDATYGTYVPLIKGYILVVTPTTDKLCAHFHWSGDRAKTDYEEYIESNIAIPSIPSMSEWGLAGISASGTMAQDSIDLDKMVYTKRIGRVDLGSLNWNKDTSMNRYAARVADIRQYGSDSIIANVLSAKYPTIKLVDGKAGVLGVSTISGYVSITDSSYSNVTSFKAAMQGVMLYYELATPEEYPIVTKTAPNYIGSDYGVEEFTGSKIPLAANILFYMRSLVGEMRNFLDQLYTNTQKSDAKEVANYITNGIEDNKQLAINAPNLALRALYIAAGALYNNTSADITRTAPWGETVVHKAGHYYLNGLGDITDAEMLIIFNLKESVYRLDIPRVLQSAKARTLIPVLNVGFLGDIIKINGSYTFFGSSIEVLYWGKYLDIDATTGMPVAGASIYYNFNSCSNLRIIFPINLNATTSNTNAFAKLPALQIVRLFKLKVSVSFADSSQIDKSSVLYMIQNAVPTKAITITLHADAYARLNPDLEENADIKSALEAQPLITLASA